MRKTAPTVLLATADDFAREFSTLMLARAGVRVEQAENGEQAFLKADALRPDAVVSQWQLPDVDGVALRARIRGNSRTSTIPILIVNGSPNAWLKAITIVGDLLSRRVMAVAN